MQTSAELHYFPTPEDRGPKKPQYFTRQELTQIIGRYGHGVSSGRWRDYAVNMGGDIAEFLIYRRTPEAPLYRIIKDVRLRAKQGMWRLVATDGKVLRRGHDLAAVLRRLDR